MQREVYLIRDSYHPNTATTNRFLGFAKGFSELNCKTKVVFIRPNKNLDKVTWINNNITFEYLWEGKRLAINKYKAYLQQLLWLIKFVRRLKVGDKIILFGSTEYLLLFTIFKKKYLYHELTEHPDIGRSTKSIFWNYYHRLYLKRCQSLSGLFVISSPLKRYFIQIGTTENKVHVINMIADSSRFNTLVKTTNSSTYIAYCGAIVNRKDGVDVLIKAFNLVLKSIPDIELWLLGDFPFERDKIINTNLVQEFQINDKVKFLGEVSSEIMPQILKDAGVLVLARPQSLQAEHGFPTKLGEYLLTANPVVVTKVGDIPKFLKDKESAYLCEADNLTEIANNICYALLNKAEAENIGKNGRNVALRHFDYIIESEKILKIIFENI